MQVFPGELGLSSSARVEMAIRKIGRAGERTRGRGWHTAGGYA
jgi:hypothetical protein